MNKMEDNMQTKRQTLHPTAKLSIRRWVILLASGFCLAVSAHSATLTNLFFLHHSTGNGLITGGDMRGVISAYNAAHSTMFKFWDHGYNGDGLRNPDGTSLGTSYEIPGDNTNPDGLYYLWTSAESDASASRNTILINHQVIAFKSCFPASEIPDAATLNQYKTWYLGMRDVFDQHLDHLFVVMSTPPLHRLATTATSANNARQFATWLKSQEYTGGHNNVVCFDLFDYLAGTDNMLKYDYEGSHEDSDSHPNDLGNQTVGPIFANFLITSALNYNATDSDTNNVPDGETHLGTPTIRANGVTNEVTVSSPDTLSVTVEMNAGDAAGVEADWWIIACAPSAGAWFYLNNAMQWTPFFADNLATCQPAYQGALFNLAPVTVLDGWTLPQGSYLFLFAVDQMDGILNYPAGPIELSMVTVVVD